MQFANSIFFSKLKEALNGDSAIAIIEMSLKYLIFGFYT